MSVSLFWDSEGQDEYATVLGCIVNARISVSLRLDGGD